MSYYIKTAGTFLTVDLRNYTVKTVQGNASDDYKWTLQPLETNQFVVRHDATRRFLELPPNGPVRGITEKNDNTTLSFTIDDATRISNNALANPEFLKIVANNGVTTTDAALATTFSITAA